MKDDVMFHQKFDPHTTYFISDTHRNHRNICRGTSTWNENTRDFDTLDEMNQAIDDSLILPNGSTLFHLGDTLFGDKSLIVNFVSHIRQTCDKVYLIYGNHDDFIRRNHAQLFDGCFDYMEIVLGKRLVCLSHFPLYTWRDVHRGSYHLHGHTHGNLDSSYYEERAALDLGWDIHKRPLSLQEIDEMLRNKPRFKEGHHA